jgi:hypothetical protein
MSDLIATVRRPRPASQRVTSPSDDIRAARTGASVSGFDMPPFAAVKFAYADMATVPFAVGAYITAAYWFTASTSLANPAVTIARACPIRLPAFGPPMCPASSPRNFSVQARPLSCSGGSCQLSPERADETVVPRTEGT